MKYKFPVVEVVQLLDECIVIYDWEYLSDSTDPNIGENVQLLDETGKVIWTVNGMSSDAHWHTGRDVFVGTRTNGGSVELVSFSGNSFSVDLKTGRVKFHSFLK